MALHGIPQEDGGIILSSLLDLKFSTFSGEELSQMFSQEFKIFHGFFFLGGGTTGSSLLRGWGVTK